MAGKEADAPEHGTNGHSHRTKAAINPAMRYPALLLSTISSLVALAQTGPGGVGSTSNMVLWFSADHGVTAPTLAVSQWDDRSGRGNHATQLTANRQPAFLTNAINGYPAIQFDNDQAAPDLLRVPDNATLEGMNGLTGFVVYDLNAGTAAAAPRCFLSKRNAPDVQHAYGWFLWNSGSIVAQHVDIDGTGNRLAGSSGHVPGNTYINGFSYHGANPSNTQDLILYNGNSAVGNRSESSSSVPNYSSDLTIGVLTGHTGAGANTSRFNGRIAEIILYNVELNSVQTTIVNNALAAKYGTTLGTLDLYTMDNAVNGNYDHDVAGIGRINGSIQHTDAKGTGIVRINNASGLNNNEYLFWGHDNSALGTWGISDHPAGMQGRWERTWRVSEVLNTGAAADVGAVDITFDLTGFTPISAFDLLLLVDTDNDGVFADELPIAGATNTGGNNYTFAGVTALSNGRRFTLGTANLSTTPLPIELVSFTAEPDGAAVRLTWTTASERNNATFTIERSMDLHAWAEVLVRPGAGNSQTLLTYTDLDEYPLPGTSYYRLKQTDTDGTSTWSDAVPVHRKADVQVIIHPVPFQELLVVDTPPDQLLSVELFSMNGQRLAVPQQRGTDRTTLDTSVLPAGSYVISVQTVNGPYTTTVVKGQ